MFADGWCCYESNNWTLFAYARVIVTLAGVNLDGLSARSLPLTGDGESRSIGALFRG